MQRYTTVFLDLDKTLFDFHASQHLALERIFRQEQLPFTPENEQFYVQTNHHLWQVFDQGGIAQDDLGPKRWEELLRHLGLDTGRADALNDAYEHALGEYGILLPGAEELCQALAESCALYILTNGMVISQTGRLARSAVAPYIRKMYISQAMGCRKPEPAFFHQVIADLALTKEELAKTVMVGDGLVTDIQGGIQAGLDTIWVCWKGETPPPDLRPTWIARSMEDIRRIILGA